MGALRLVAFDATDIGPLRVPRVERREDGTAQGTGGLTRFWRIGAQLHRFFLHADAVTGARSWSETLRWAADASQTRGQPIAELQAWGHGGWGYMGMHRTRLDADALRPDSPLREAVDALRDVLAPDALVWLRCCSTFGTASGHDFARRLADRLRVRVAGHTFIIGGLQSGTHSLCPGASPAWTTDEGVETDEHSVRRAQMSSASAPRTITCLRFELPRGW
jgi:hypothetical protein